MFVTQNLLPICEISRSSFFFFPLIQTPSSIPFKKDASNTWNRLKILQAMNFWQQKINKRKRLVPLQNFEMSYTKIDLFLFFLAKNRFYLQCILFFTPSFERFLSLVWQFFSKVRLLILKVLWAKTVWTCDCCKFHLQMKAGPRPNASADVMNI